MSKPIDLLVKLERENQRLKDANTQLRKMNKKLSQRGYGYDDFIAELRETLHTEQGWKSHFSYNPTEKYTILDPCDPSHTEVAAVACSDLHLTENVRSDDSNGINKYNTIIGANRLYGHAQRVKSILARHRAMYTITGIWSPLLGDIINGTIHDEQVYTNDMTDQAAVVLGARLLKMFYLELGTLGLPIQIDAIVGNHPRTTAKMPTKQQAHTNMDWVVYEMLGDMLHGNDQFEMTTWTSQIGQRRIFDWNYRFEHGIDVQNGKEEALEDRLRAMFDDPTYRHATGYQGAAFDQIVIGNLHKSKFLERTIVNGTYTGQNELGQSWRLKPIRALQNMWGISPSHVRTFEYQLDMTDIKSERATNPFSEYAVWFLRRHGLK